MLTVAFDMDEVTFDLINPWLQLNNELYDDNVKKEDIKHWGIHEYVKSGKDVYCLLETEGLYLNLKPMPGSQEVIETLLKKNYQVCFASASPKTAYFEKHMSVKKNFPFFDTDNIVFTKNKGLVNAHILIDDGVHNLEKFNGIPVIYTQPWNINENRFIRVDDWSDIKALFNIINRNISNIISRAAYDKFTDLAYSFIRELLLNNVEIINMEIKLTKEKIEKGEIKEWL